MPPVIMTSPKDDGQARQISVTRQVSEYPGRPCSGRNRRGPACWILGRDRPAHKSPLPAVSAFVSVHVI